MLIVRIIPVVVKIRVKRKIKLKRENLNWKILWFSNVNHVRIVLCLARGFSHPVCTSFVFLIKKGGVFQFQLAASLWSNQFKSYDIVVMKRNFFLMYLKHVHFLGGPVIPHGMCFKAGIFPVVEVIEESDLLLLTTGESGRLSTG